MDDTAFLRIRGLRKSYEYVDALRGVDLTLARGDFLCLFGPNGAGKTTLIKIVADLLKPTSGTVEITGGPDLDGDIRSRIGLISHQTLLYDELTARENLQFYSSLYRVPDPDDKIDSLLHTVGLHNRRNERVSTFSRGMQQRLSIARALINDPVLLLLDEPYSGLDQFAASVLSDHLKKLHAQHRTIIMVTHNLTRGLETANRIGILSEGRLVYLKDRDEIDLPSFEGHYLMHMETD